MDLSSFFQIILNGLSIGSVYAMFAMGYTLIFSILGIINFAHGAVFAIGAYATLCLATGSLGTGLLRGVVLPFTLPLPVAALFGCLFAGLVSVGLDRCAFRPLRARGADPLLSLISSLGAALVLVNGLQLVFGSETLAFPDDLGLPPGVLPPVLEFGGALIRTTQCVILVVGSVVLLALGVALKFSKAGKALRAVAENPKTASLLGISVSRIVTLTFFVCGLLGGLSGVLVASSFGISGPYFGMVYGLKGLAVVILGGLGNMAGCLLAGVLVGMAEAFVPSDFSAYKDAVAFSILFAVLCARPQGLLGRPLMQKV